MFAPNGVVGIRETSPQTRHPHERRCVAALRIDRAKVAQYAADDRGALDWQQEFCIEGPAGALHRLEQPFAPSLIKQHTTTERVDEGGGIDLVPYEEMAGHADTVEGNTEAPANLHQ